MVCPSFSEETLATGARVTQDPTTTPPLLLANARSFPRQETRLAKKLEHRRTFFFLLRPFFVGNENYYLFQKVIDRIIIHNEVRVVNSVKLKGNLVADPVCIEDFFGRSFGVIVISS